MGTGTRRRAAARRHRVHHHRHQHRRRRRTHHHHRTHHNVTRVVGLGSLFSQQQRHPTGAPGNQATVVTISSTTSSSSTGGNTCRLPPWFGCAVVTLVLLSLSIVGFAVPAVPIPVAITSTFMFLMIIGVPYVTNLARTRAARREGAVDDPEAPPPATATGGVVITEFSTVDEASSANGPLGGVFNYDPPPSFNDAMEDTASSASPWLAGAPAQTPPGYHSTIGGTLQDPAYPPMGAPLTEEELPPPPSYEDAISARNTYTPQ